MASSARQTREVGAAKAELSRSRTDAEAAVDGAAERIVLDHYVKPDRKYRWMPSPCDHCDASHQRIRAAQPQDDFRGWLYLGRDDYLRRNVCKHCDLALDEMLGESPKAPSR